MEVFQRMTENNKQAEGTDTKAKTNYDTAIFAGGCFWLACPFFSLRYLK